MQRVAVFVDAGYLFAQGSTALTGNKALRADLSLSARSVIEEFKGVAKIKATSCSLLRIYWYDGALAGTPMTADQASIADLDDTKLRLGFVNSHGQQKGVDSLIVTDLIELAPDQQCLRAISAPAVIQRKVTNGYRAMWAAKSEADIRTVVDTARLRPGANTFKTILQTITA